MLIAVWAVGLLLLVLWTATMWVSWLGWTMLAALPWSQVSERIREIQLPPALEAWLGTAWREWLEAAAPMVEWAIRMLQGSAGWLEDLMPAVLLVVWGVGVFTLLLLTALVAVLVGWLRERRRAERARPA
ncbi:hypothetical protein EZ313_18440 [Ramlibacter henchirensis]|uniref:Uncharacterized protein n=1 Tax=Ramlibacter henchirensis TaxID=204072 RepID=A0A4Z0BPX2_9BURK|nr:hypothetical protein [Ramlibacter henchirensis]TFZ00440.1 hypothetical protein EZ313_18440 [Ramlibacter henchirensis]